MCCVLECFGTGSGWDTFAPAGTDSKTESVYRKVMMAKKEPGGFSLSLVICNGGKKKYIAVNS
jgi:hypothetical protein